MNRNSQLKIGLSLLFVFCVIFYIKVPNEHIITSIKNTVIVSIFSFTMIISLLLLCKNSKINLIFRVITSLFTLYLFCVRYMYGEFTFGVIGAIHDTSKAESIEFLKTVDIKLIISSIIVFVLFYISLKCINSLPKKLNKYIYFSFSGMFLITVALVYYKDHAKNYLTDPTATDIYGVKNYLYPIIYLCNRNIYLSPIADYYLFDKVNNNYNKEVHSEWTNVKSNKDNTKLKDVYIVNVGESAIKNHFKLYGYKYNTSYNIDGLVALDGAISPSVQTRLSVPRILSKNINESTYNPNLNIIDLANQAGFDTYWVSNQSKNGLYDTPISIIAERAKHVYFSNIDYEHAKPDDVLLPEIDKIIAEKTNKPKVIFINTMGSHADFCDRVSAKDQTIHTNRDKMLDCYDDSILYGFNFLVKIRDLLKEKHLSYSMFYFSDHGLVKSKSSPFLVHGVTDDNFSKQAVEIPFFMITELKNKQPKMIHRSYNLRKFYATFAEWLGITADQISYKDSAFHSESSTPSDEKILDGTYKVRTVKP